MPEYRYKTVKNESHEKTYRCKVVGNNSATLLVNRRFFNVFVRETFGAGFTIGLPTKYKSKITVGQKYELRFDDRRVLVTAESFSDTVHGESRLQVTTVKEFEPKERWAFRLPFTKGVRIIAHDAGIDSGAAYGGFVLLLFCVLSLPGLGDQLGTAPRIERALHIVGQNIAEMAHSFSNR